MVSFFYSGPMPGPAATGCRGGWWAALRSTGIGPLVLTLMVFVGRGHAGEAVRDGEVEAQLISAATSLVPGQVATIGLRLKMDPGWHTYWANPGDSGMPTQIDWRLPEGYEISDFQWPAPKRHVEAGLASYIYEDEVVLPLRLTVPDTAEAGDQITLAATAGWLVCRDICSPGGAELSLSLPVSDSATEAAIDPRWVDLFRAADTLRPRLYPRAKLSILRVDGGYRITVDDPALESPWVAVDGHSNTTSGCVSSMHARQSV